MSHLQGLECEEVGQELAGIRMHLLDRVVKPWSISRWTNLSTDKVIILPLRNVHPWISKITIRDLKLATRKVKTNHLQMVVQAHLPAHLNSYRCLCGIRQLLVWSCRTKTSMVTPEISLIRLLISLQPQTKIRRAIKELNKHSSRSKNRRTQLLQISTQNNLWIV